MRPQEKSVTRAEFRGSRHEPVQRRSAAQAERDTKRVAMSAVHLAERLRKGKRSWLRPE
jgi:hypothetical protein